MSDRLDRESAAMRTYECAGVHSPCSYRHGRDSRDALASSVAQFDDSVRRDIT
jgi:hypothetical protein